MPNPPPTGHCWTCGYPLAGLGDRGNCPECGRPFDRADPASVNFGRPMGRLARRALAPLGRTAPLLAAAAGALIFATVRRPVDAWRLDLVDFRYYADVRAWRARWPGLTGVDAAYMAGLTLWAAALLILAVRLAARAVAVARYRPPKFQRGRLRRRAALVVLLSAANLLGVAGGWPYRLGQRWVATAIAEDRAAGGPPDAGGWPYTVSGRPFQPQTRLSYTPDRPLDLSTAQAIIALRAVMLRDADRTRRTMAVRIFTESFDQHAPFSVNLLAAIAARPDADPELRALLTHILALQYRIVDAPGPRFAAALDDPDPRVRAAAADALGILRGDAYVQRDNDPPAIVLDTDPPVRVEPAGRDPLDAHPAIPPAARDRLERMMLDPESTPDERDAAARALANWPPPKYRLRYAEWGVFMTDPAGNPRFVREQIDEVPPFVHRIANTAGDVTSRIGSAPTTVYWKPVIHLTADRPLAVDLSVGIDQGRPWVAYPRFDDLFLLHDADSNSLFGGPGFDNRGPFIRPRRSPRTRDLPPDRATTAPDISGPLDSLDRFDPPPSLAQPLADLREGYPWLTPHHRDYGWTWQTGGVGVRWQSLVVTPARQPWMSPPPVPANHPLFGWWNRLRDVDCSWVASRGEADRLLYYDGPSARTAPAAATLAPGGRVRVTEAGPQTTRPTAAAATPPPPPPPRRALYLHVTPAGIETCAITGIPAAPAAPPFAEADVSRLTPRPTVQAMADLRRLLESQGLTPGEAAGLVDIWRPAFFDRPGRRVLTIMTRDEYDRACPMTLRPPATESARVGILWTEFPEP